MQSAARIVALALLAALAACETMSNPAQQTPDTANGTAAVEAVPGQYIVVLQDNVADPSTVARDLVNAAGSTSTPARSRVSRRACPLPRRRRWRATRWSRTSKPIR